MCGCVCVRVCMCMRIIYIYKELFDLRVFVQAALIIFGDVDRMNEQTNERFGQTYANRNFSDYTTDFYFILIKNLNQYFALCILELKIV